MKRSLLALIVGIVLFSPSISLGQFFEFCDDFTKCRSCQRDPFEERIETERHDFTQSAVTVGRGVFQIESGLSYFYKDNASETESSYTAPETMLRWGVSEDIEVRIRWDYAWSIIEDEPNRIGSEDLRYALKLQMTRQPEYGWLPTSALEIRGTAPTGGDTFSTDKAEFGLDYIYQWQLTECMTFAGSTGYGSNGFGDFGLVGEHPGVDNFNAWSQSAVLGFELTEANVLYTEWYGVFSDGLAEEYSVSILNIGIDHYITDNLVIDLRLGMGLTDESDDFFTGFGGGYRF
ncbi:MAG: hypothetical protein COA78_28950 [Blastopirellula sp.]|nr:MAG: hypothetical protein COA78_28950 [Blastopirellula sp.]